MNENEITVEQKAWTTVALDAISKIADLESRRQRPSTTALDILRKTYLKTDATLTGVIPQELDNYVQPLNNS